MASPELTPRRCPLCVADIVPDVADGEALRRFLTPQARILPRRKTRLCATHQRKATQAIKRARELGLLPYTGQKTPTNRREPKPGI